jgi:hypothetical protein
LQLYHWLQHWRLARLNVRPEGRRPCASASAGGQPRHAIPLASRSPETGKPRNRESRRPSVAGCPSPNPVLCIRFTIRLEEAEAMAHRGRYREPRPAQRSARPPRQPGKRAHAKLVGFGERQGARLPRARRAPGPKSPASAHLARFSAWGSEVPGSASEASGEAGGTISL